VETKINIPRAFKELFDNQYRYKVYYGGRGGAKSHSFARALLILGAQSKLRILATRELQKSIETSVHKLFSDLIQQYNLESFWRIKKATIEALNGTEIMFKGLKYNATEIKSTEGVDICWIEEAENTSEHSYETLLPTIRKNGSQIWISFNTKNVTDPTYQRFIVNKPDNAFVKKVSWRDNPNFSETLNNERIRLERDDPIAYAHVWEGEPDTRYSGTIYSVYIERAREAGRVTDVPYKANVPVITAWDLGKQHGTCIWFAQMVGQQVRVFDYYEAFGADADIEELAKVLNGKGYLYGMHYLPHDGVHERLGMKGSISEQLRLAGHPNKILPMLSVKAGIEKGRSLLKEAWIDSKACSNGLHAMMHYAYEYDENRLTFKPNPMQNWATDASDAWRYLAQAMEYKVQPQQGLIAKKQVLYSTQNKIITPTRPKLGSLR
jgi:phage terminase large subunit